MNTQRQQGHIKYWNAAKGYGFIARTQADDVFVHISQLADGLKPRQGLAVCFRLQQDHQGRWQAHQVQPANSTMAADATNKSLLQRLWQVILTVAALLLATFILVKSITPFYGLSTPAQPPASSLLLPGSPQADNPQLQHTLQRVRQGGPYPYPQDDRTFHNRERRLPLQPAGYYREYTVATPGARDRGTRRLVTGGQPPEVWYYTDDHYRTFIRLRVRP